MIQEANLSILEVFNKYAPDTEGEPMLTATIRPNLTTGSTGDNVKYLQSKLNDFYGPILNTDGIFGYETEDWVRRFQEVCAITVDGGVRKQTWSFLEDITPYANSVHSFLRRGHTGSEVKYLQARLNHYLGTNLIVDGLFDDNTEAHVKRFQSAIQIKIDGIIGPQTWLYLDPPNFDI